MPAFAAFEMLKIHERAPSLKLQAGLVPHARTPVASSGWVPSKELAPPRAKLPVPAPGTALVVLLVKLLMPAKKCMPSWSVPLMMNPHPWALGVDWAMMSCVIVMLLLGGGVVRPFTFGQFGWPVIWTQ